MKVSYIYMYFLTLLRFLSLQHKLHHAAHMVNMQVDACSNNAKIISAHQTYNITRLFWQMYTVIYN